MTRNIRLLVTALTGALMAALVVAGPTLVLAGISALPADRARVRGRRSSHPLAAPGPDEGHPIPDPEGFR